MKYLVKDIMETDVYTCRYDQTIAEVIRIMAEKNVSGLTVIDDKRHVVGFISDGDIMKPIARQETRSLYGGSADFVLYENESMDQKVEHLLKRNTMELASKRVVYATPEMPIDQAAQLMTRKKIYKMPVIENGSLIGVIRRAAIMRFILSQIAADSQEAAANESLAAKQGERN